MYVTPHVAISQAGSWTDDELAFPQVDASGNVIH